ncbi:MAG: protein kinase domain-containing protein [Planctomycetota bacterium]
MISPLVIGAGTKLSHYVIHSRLGAGAMGEVWRARDTKLDREVAIKVLPEHFADDLERLERFEREAKALAALNHPNVAQIYGVDQIGDTCFLVLELVPGESLEERLKRGPLPVEEAIDVGRQIAEGLEAAHEAGVIHRDLKPANVRLTPDGQVKVLDFGLAKPMRESAATETATDSAFSTEAGRLLGTPTYMSPEQARGKPIDKRVDVWAFGCVLYQCLTGRRAFAGETLTDILGSVLHTSPDLTALPERTPRAVRELLARCFKKDPRLRMRDLGEARLVLERAGTQDAEELVPTARSRRWLIALLWVASLGAAVYATFLALGRPAPSPAAVVRTYINLPADLHFRELDGSLALSPDGRTLVLALGRDWEHMQLWVRPLDSLTPQQLSGTDGATHPFWSPDGRAIGFFAQGKLKRIPAAGGTVTTVCAAIDARGGTWTSRDEIVFAPAPFGGLFRVPASGGVPEAITKADGAVTHRQPHALPGDRGVLFCQGNSERDGIRLLDLDTGAVTEISDDPSDARYVAPGDLVFLRGGNLMAQSFDLASGHLTGQPRLVAERVPFDPARLSGRYCASSDGTLVYQSSADSSLEWFDLEGRSLGRIGVPAAYQDVELSPDGRRIMATVSRPDGKLDCMLLDGQTGLGLPLLGFDSAFGFAWSPDGRSIAFGREEARSSTASAAHGDIVATYVVPVDGSEPPRRIGVGGPTDWSRDGAWIAVMRHSRTTGLDVLGIRADGSGEPQVVAATAADEVGGLFSPDSRWIGYGSNQSGEFRMYAAPVGRPGAVRPMTSHGASSRPTWTDDGRQVFVGPTGELWELPVTFREDELDVGEHRVLFGGRKVSTATVGRLSVTRDGKRLLAIVPEEGAGEPPLIVVQHGLEGSRR